MINNSVLVDISSNLNTGIEYEIALFYCLLYNHPEEQVAINREISKRPDSLKIHQIISYTDISPILNELNNRNLLFNDASLETQNDEIGPADVVVYAKDKSNTIQRIGLSVKYANTCTLNVTGRRFITDEQIKVLKKDYQEIFVPQYLMDMSQRYGHASNWHRKNSAVTDRMIDTIRDAVILNWPNIMDKSTLLKDLFHDSSPIEFWVVKYSQNGFSLKTIPSTIDMKYAMDVRVEKFQTSYIAFYLGDIRIGRMQVKFNNGFLENNYNHSGSRKKQNPDIRKDGLEFNYGQPFGSWNFSVED